VSERARVTGAYAVMCAIWGTTWLAIKLSLHYVPPITGVGVRFVLAGLLLAALAAALGKRTTLAALPWHLVGVLAVFMFGINYVLTYTAETHVGSGMTAVLFGTFPFFMFGFGRVAGERSGPLVWLGAAIAFGGVALIFLTSNVSGTPLYALAAVGAALSSAYGNAYAKRHSHHDPLITLPAAMLLSGAAITVLGLVLEHPHPDIALSLPSILTICYLALLGSGAAFFLNLWLLQRVAAWIVGLSALIIPVIAVVVGVFAGGETFGPREIGGALLVIAGVWLALRST